MTTIDTSYYLSNNTQEQRKAGDALGKDDFLKLLITQLRNQDPTSPMDNSEFIAQMATFSSLEQMVNIGSKIDQIIENNAQTSLVTGSELIGKLVTWKDDEDQEISAIVKSVLMSNGKVQYEMDDGNGTKISSDQMIKIVTE